AFFSGWVRVGAARGGGEGRGLNNCAFAKTAMAMSKLQQSGIFRGIKSTSTVAVYPINPTGQPTRFISGRRRIVNAARQNRSRRPRKFRWGISRRRLHFFKHLQKTPALIVISLRMQNAFAFK